MKLFLLRHGLAVEAGARRFAKDSERPLTPKGERKLWTIAEAVKALGLSFDRILSSPYLRASQTAEIIVAALGAQQELELSDTLAPAGSPAKLIEHLNRLNPAPESVLLVGHEPYLSELISLLLSGETGLLVTMKKGGLCKLSAPSLRPGRCATLEWLLTPKQMARMA